MGGPALDPVAPEVMYLVISLNVFFSIVLSLSVIFSIVCLMLVLFVILLDFLLTLLLLRGGGVCGGGVLTFTLVSKGAFPSFLRISLGTFSLLGLAFIIGWGGGWALLGTEFPGWVFPILRGVGVVIMFSVGGVPSSFVCVGG